MIAGPKMDPRTGRGLPETPVPGDSLRDGRFERRFGVARKTIILKRRFYLAPQVGLEPKPFG